MNNDYYITEDFTYNTLLYDVIDYLKANNNIDESILHIFNKINTLFDTKNDYTKELGNEIFNLMDNLGFYDDVKKGLIGGNN